VTCNSNPARLWYTALTLLRPFESYNTHFRFIRLCPSCCLITLHYQCGIYQQFKHQRCPCKFCCQFDSSEIR
jgi:hypothetical protein